MSHTVGRIVFTDCSFAPKLLGLWNADDLADFLAALERELEVAAPPAVLVGVARAEAHPLAVADRPDLVLAALGLRISLTEVDMRIQTNPAPDSALLAKQREGYKTLMGICLAQPACKAFFTWGVNDSQSWIPGAFSGYGQALLFDNTSANGVYNRKAVYYGVQEALTATSIWGHKTNLKIIADDHQSHRFDLRGRLVTALPYNPIFVTKKTVNPK